MVTCAGSAHFIVHADGALPAAWVEHDLHTPQDYRTFNPASCLTALNLPPDRQPQHLVE